MINEVQSPTQKRIQQLAKAIEMGIPESAILLNANIKLRNANRMRRKQDQRVLSKTRDLSRKEAQTLKWKEVEIERKRQKRAAQESLPTSVDHQSQVIKKGTPKANTISRKIELKSSSDFSGSRSKYIRAWIGPWVAA